MAGFQLLCRTEGIIPALESAHAISHAAKMAREMPKEAILVVNLSGRGDKDVEQVQRILGAARRAEEGGQS
jgi:tryptophan synthase beta chain